VGSALDVDASMGYFRTLAVIADSHLAFLPLQVKAGDHICILLGYSVPVILRPVSGTQQKGLCFVGESYVHGMMDGEIMMILDGKDYPCGQIYTRVAKRNSLPQYSKAKIERH